MRYITLLCQSSALHIAQNILEAKPGSLGSN